MDRTEASAATICRCNPATEKLALALAAQAWSETERAAQWQTLQQLIRKSPNDIILLTGSQGERVLVALIAQVLVGNTAIVWPPQFASQPDADACRATEQLFARLDRDLYGRGVHLAQGLLPKDQPAAAALLKEGGFSHAADLLYLSSPFDCFPDQALQLPFDLEIFGPAAADRLIALIDRTYRGTLDCPRLDGMRETADVVQGYQAVGEFRYELWQIVRSAGQDVGCLLVNLHPNAKQAEIVYAALVPEVRGRGWGLELTRQAQWLARIHGCEQVVLAVDAANEPAIRMYAAAGFSEWDQKQVWLRSLR